MQNVQLMIIIRDWQWSTAVSQGAQTILTAIPLLINSMTAMSDCLNRATSGTGLVRLKSPSVTSFQTMATGTGIPTARPGTAADRCL